MRRVPAPSARAFGAGGGRRAPWIWTQGGGTRILDDDLADFVIAVPAGYTLLNVTGHSADGRPIVGTATRLSDGLGAASIASIPAPTPAALLALGIIGIAPFRRRRQGAQ